MDASDLSRACKRRAPNWKHDNIPLSQNSVKRCDGSMKGYARFQRLWHFPVERLQISDFRSPWNSLIHSASQSEPSYIFLRAAPLSLGPRSLTAFSDPAITCDLVLSERNQQGHGSLPAAVCLTPVHSCLLFRDTALYRRMSSASSIQQAGMVEQWSRSSIEIGSVYCIIC